MFISNSKFYVKSTISSTQWTWTTFNISQDFETGQNIDSDWEILSIVLKTSTQIERMTITCVWWVATIVKRGLTQADTKVEDAWLKKQWTDWTIGYVTALASDLLDIDKEWDVSVLSNDIDFTWEVEFKWPTRWPTFADTTARDLVYTSPVNSDECFIIWVWKQVYNGWVWVTLDEWTPTPNASETVAGKVEIATDAQMDAWTDTWETWALLVWVPSQFQRKEFIENLNIDWLTEQTEISWTENLIIWDKKITSANLLRANKEVFEAWEDITQDDIDNWRNALRLWILNSQDESFISWSQVDFWYIWYDNSVTKIWQSFTINWSWKKINSITISLRKVWSPTWILSMKVYSNTWTTLIATSSNTINESSLTTWLVNYTFNFNNEILVNWLNYFTIETNRSNSTSDYSRCYWATISGLYSWWNYYRITNTWTWSIQTTEDLSFSVSINEETSRVYKTDATNKSKIDFRWFATNPVTIWNNVVVDTDWVSATQTGLTIWSDYYLANTPWAISTTPWTNIVSVWKAVSTTWIQINSKKINDDDSYDYIYDTGRNSIPTNMTIWATTEWDYWFISLTTTSSNWFINNSIIWKEWTSNFSCRWNDLFKIELEFKMYTWTLHNWFVFWFFDSWSNPLTTPTWTWKKVIFHITSTTTAVLRTADWTTETSSSNITIQDNWVDVYRLIFDKNNSLASLYKNSILQQSIALTLPTWTNNMRFWVWNATTGRTVYIDRLRLKIKYT